MTKTLKYTFLIVSLLIVGKLTSQAQVNIASKASKLSTSFVSTWEKLSAINDGYDPKSSGDKNGAAYGNWNGTGSFNKWNWVQYDFAAYYLISRSEVYWWTDGGGIQIPYSSYLEYWDVFAGKWMKIETQVGVSPDKYNVTDLGAVLTNKIRLNCISTAASGILEWKVFGLIQENVPLKSTVSALTPLAKGAKSMVQVKAIGANGIPVSGYQFKLDVSVNNQINNNREAYQLNSQSVTSDVKGILLPLTNAAGETSFELAIPAAVDPNDGIRVSVKLENGVTEISTVQYFEPGLIPPVLVADATDNNVDHDIQISFTDQVTWRNAVSKVTVDGVALASSDYLLSAGSLVLKPSNGNNLLTKSGTKIIGIVAVGYVPLSLNQEIQAGAINLKNSYIDTTINIYKPSTTSQVVYAFDSYKNPIKGYVFKYDTELVNKVSTTTEVFKVAGLNATSSTGNLLTATDSEGKATLAITVPAVVDLLDGIQIHFKLNDGITPLDPVIGYIHQAVEKEVYVPRDVKALTEFKWEQTAQSKNFVAFWGSKTGPNPLKPLAGVSFDPNVILNELEKYYSFYLDSMKFILNPTEGNMGKYKFAVVLFNTWNSGYSDNGAYGASVDDVIGCMWMAPQGGFVIAHELGHAFQAMVPIQYPGKGFKNINDNKNVGMYWEMCANYMGFLSSGQTGNMISPLFANTSMLQYLSTIDYRQYEAVYLPAYIIDKFGIQALGKQWRSADVGDNPFDALGKSLGMTRDEMRREAGLFAMHNVTWDYSIGNLIKNSLYTSDPSVVCREYTYLQAIKDKANTFIVPREMAPADYGYNIIPVFPNDGASVVTAKISGYDNEPAKGGGWSYGFVAVDAAGKPRYEAVALETDAQATLTIQPTDKKFYLVVIASPKATNTYPWTPSWPTVYRFPYSVQFENALPAGQKDGYNSQKNTIAGATHSNGGGWVATTASVEPTVYVGPNAQVLGKAKVQGKARIEDFAVVTDDAIVKENAIVRGNAIVGKKATIYGSGLVEKAARVYGGKVYGNGVVTGSAVAFNCTVFGNAVLKDVTWISGATISGNAVVGGDLNKFTTCDTGVYLQLSRTTCDKDLWNSLNNDVNQVVDQYTYPLGDIPEAPKNLAATLYRGTSVILKWNKSRDNDSIINYIVFVNGKADHLVTSLTDTISGLSENTSYRFSLMARDNAGNFSVQSEEAKASTLTSMTTIPQKSTGKFTIHPNPATSEFTINMSDTKNATVFISDSTGKLLYKSAFNNELKLNKNILEGDGLYLVRIDSEQGSATEKLIIAN
jgi:carbonic anhydrase/acetyltransferase-like protein (isoleucine patch superfamily)